MIGIWVCARSSLTIESIAAIDAPAPRPRALARWLAGPSAIGSENGTPSSIRSAPRASSSSTSRRVVSRSGSPATMNGISAASPRARRSRNLRFILPAPAMSLHRHPEGLGDRAHILVAAAGQIHDHDLFLWQLRRQLDCVRHRMRALECGDYSFGFGQHLQRIQRLGVGHRGVFGAAHVVQPRMLGAYAGIIEACGDRMGLANLAQFVLQQVGFVAVQDADTALRNRGGVMGSTDAEAGGLDANQFDFGILDKRIEQADSVRAAVDACDQHVGEASFMLENLAARLAADDRLEVADDHRIWMRPRAGADQIVGAADGCDPVAQRLVHRVFEALAAGFDGGDLRAEEFHPKDVQRLALDVDRAHEDFAFALEQGGHRRRRDAMLTGTGFGADARLVHPDREERLAEGIVHLVRAGVAEVLALQINLRTAELRGQICAQVEGSWAADVLAR